MTDYDDEVMAYRQGKLAGEPAFERPVGARMTDRETLIADLSTTHHLYAQDKSVPQSWRDAERPEISWEELAAVSDLCGRAVIALTEAQLERDDAREAAPAPVVTREQVCLHESYVMANGGDHEDDCPCDDTCDCAWKPRNDAVNAVCRYLAALTGETGGAHE